MATDENRDTFLSPAAIQYQTCVRCDQLTLRELSGLTSFLWRSNLLARSSPETSSARSVFRNIPTPPKLPSHSNHSAMSVFLNIPTHPNLPSHFLLPESKHVLAVFSPNAARASTDITGRLAKRLTRRRLRRETK